MLEIEQFVLQMMQMHFEYAKYNYIAFEIDFLYYLNSDC